MSLGVRLWYALIVLFSIWGSPQMSTMADAADGIWWTWLAVVITEIARFLRREWKGSTGDAER